MVLVTFTFQFDDICHFEPVIADDARLSGSRQRICTGLADDVGARLHHFKTKPIMSNTMNGGGRVG
jgi:hypothetical protein